MPAAALFPFSLTKVIALAGIAALSLGLLWTLDAITHVERYDEVRIIDPWGERATFTYAPILANGSGELAMGEPGYFTSDAPSVRVGFEWALQDARAERVTALGSLRLVVHRDASPGKPAWTHEEELASATHSGAHNDTLPLSGVIDLVATAQRVEATAGHRATDATWTVTARVKFATSPNAAHSADASEFILPITYSPPLYLFPETAPINKDHAQREVIPHSERADATTLLRQPAGPILIILGIAAFARTVPSLVRENEAPP